MHRRHLNAPSFGVRKSMNKQAVLDDNEHLNGTPFPLAASAITDGGNRGQAIFLGSLRNMLINSQAFSALVCASFSTR